MVCGISADDKDLLEAKLQNFYEAIQLESQKEKYAIAFTNIGILLDEVEKLAKTSVSDLYKGHYLNPAKCTIPDLKITQIRDSYVTQLEEMIKINKELAGQNKAKEIAKEIKELLGKIVVNFGVLAQSFFDKYLWPQITKDLKLEQEYLDKILASPDMFRQNYQCLKDVGLEENIAYVQKILDYPDLFEESYQFLVGIDLSYLSYYVEKALENLVLFSKDCQYLRACGIKETCQIDQVLNISDVLKKNHEMLKKLGFDNKPEYVKKVLDCPDKLTQEFECLEKLRVVYDEVVARLKSNQFKVHGLAGGSSIMFNGRLRCVPKGVSKIWAQLADDEGNFKWMNDVDGALAQAKSQADQRQGNEGLAVVSIFFGSYRDNQTKAMYKEISGLLAS